jgi:ribonucleoside-diphosphate reductase alpha chain
VFRVLGIEYLERTDLAHIVTEDLKGAPPAPKATAGHATGHPVGREHRGNGNGHGNGGTSPQPAAATPAAPAAAISAPVAAKAQAATGASAARPREEARAGDTGPDAMLGKIPGDAPLCDNCGHITIRNGTCYKCLNCGTSMGCS